MLFIDFETRSATPITSGVYRYVEDPYFRIQLFSFAYDDDEITTLDLMNPLVVIPEQVKKDMLDKTCTKVAHNSQFERICYSRFCGMPTGQYIEPEGWICTMTLGLFRGFPAKLEALGNALGIPEDAKKMKEGKRLIAKYAVPQKTKTGQIYFNEPEPDLFGVDTDWDTYKKYNNTDVAAERAIYKALVRRGGGYGMMGANGVWSPTLWEEFWISERVNDRGVRLDRKFVNGAVDLSNVFSEKQAKEFKATCDKIAKLRGVSEIENVKSIQQLQAVSGFTSVKKEALTDYLSHHKEPKTEMEKLLCDFCRYRLSDGKTSVKKYEKMQECINSDGRVRGLFRFGGAGQTLRYAGRLVQLQNLSKNHFGTIEKDGVLVSPEVQILKARISKLDQTVFDESEDFLDILSQLVRPSLIPAKDHIFAVADFSAIEARVLSWLAGEQWRIDAFRNGEDIYCATASKMFGVPVVKHGENGELRAKGKVAELACGYGGGVGALQAFGADKMGMNEEQMKEIVTNWRNSSPRITGLWWDLERAVVDCLLTGEMQQLAKYVGLRVYALTNELGNMDLIIELPNGRSLFYNDAEIRDAKDDPINLSGRGMDQRSLSIQRRKVEQISFMRTEKNNLLRTPTYSGKLTENVIQALARDLLQEALKNLQNEGYGVVAHIHDECIVEVPKIKPDGTFKTPEELTAELDKISDIMARGCSWSKGLPLRADGYLCNYYMKDSEGAIDPKYTMNDDWDIDPDDL